MKLYENLKLPIRPVRIVQNPCYSCITDSTGIYKLMNNLYRPIRKRAKFRRGTSTYTGQKKRPVRAVSLDNIDVQAFRTGRTAKTPFFSTENWTAKNDIYKRTF